jgi:hypothetical protein
MAESAKALMCSNARVAGHILLPGQADTPGQSPQVHRSQVGCFGEPEDCRRSARWCTAQERQDPDDCLR